MKLVDIISEYYYLKDTNNTPFIPFKEQESNVRDFYYRIAYNNIHQLIASYISQQSWLGKLIRGCISSFINNHGMELNKNNYNSLAKRIITTIGGTIKTYNKSISYTKSNKIDKSYLLSWLNQHNQKQYVLKLDGVAWEELKNILNNQ